MNILGNHPLMSESLQQGGIPYGKKCRGHGRLRIGAWHVVPLITKKIGTRSVHVGSRKKISEVSQIFSGFVMPHLFSAIVFAALANLPFGLYLFSNIFPPSKIPKWYVNA